MGYKPVAVASYLRQLATMLGSTDEAEGDLREAIAIFRAHLGSDHPSYADAMFALGQNLLYRNKLPEAETTLLEAVELYRKVHDKKHPYQPVVRRYAAWAMARQHKWKEAEAFMEHERDVWSLDPDFEYVRIRLKACQGDLQAAMDLTSQDLQRNPRDGYALLNRAVLSLQMGNLEEYRRTCRAVLAIPWGIEPKVALASLLLQVQDTDFDSACKQARYRRLPQANSGNLADVAKIARMPLGASTAAAVLIRQMNGRRSAGYVQGRKRRRMLD